MERYGEFLMDSPSNDILGCLSLMDIDNIQDCSDVNGKCMEGPALSCCGRK